MYLLQGETMTADTPKSEFEKEFEKRYGIGNPEKCSKCGARTIECPRCGESFCEEGCDDL